MTNPKPKPSPIASSPTSPIRILFLHGYTQSGPLFSSKTGALRKALQTGLAPRTLEFRYPTGPIPLRPEDIPGYQASDLPATDNTHDDGPETNIPVEVETWGWWRRQHGPPNGSSTTTAMTGRADSHINPSASPSLEKDDHDDGIVYTGFEEGLATIADCIREHGPFDGVIGFSQGACAAAILTSILERVNDDQSSETSETPETTKVTQDTDPSLAPFLAPFLVEGQPIQSRLKFAVLYSGFRSPGRRYEGFWRTSIRTPSLHVRGGLDTVVEEARSEALVDAFHEDSRRVLVHPGGHFVPNQRMWTTAVLAFVKDVLDTNV